jgi:hypothetical protein
MTTIKVLTAAVAHPGAAGSSHGAVCPLAPVYTASAIEMVEPATAAAKAALPSLVIMRFPSRRVAHIFGVRGYSPER